MVRLNAATNDICMARAISACRKAGSRQRYRGAAKGTLYASTECAGAGATSGVVRWLRASAWKVATAMSPRLLATSCPGLLTTGAAKRVTTSATVWWVCRSASVIAAVLQAREPRGQVLPIPAGPPAATTPHPCG